MFIRLWLLSGVAFFTLISCSRPMESVDSANGASLSTSSEAMDSTTASVRNGAIEESTDHRDVERPSSVVSEEKRLGDSRTTSLLGKRAFEQGMCGKCHGVDGKGSKKGPDLTDENWFHCDGTAAGILSVLKSGIEQTKFQESNWPFAMNPATNLVKSESQLEALAEYVAALQRNGDGPQEESD